MGEVVKAFWLCAASCTLMLQGCVSSESATFTKSNVAPAVAQRDSEMCWQQAQKKQVPDDKAAENAVGAFIIGGMVGVAVSQAANEDAYRGSLRDQCMAKKGYTKAKAT